MSRPGAFRCSIHVLEPDAKPIGHAKAVVAGADVKIELRKELLLTFQGSTPRREPAASYIDVGTWVKERSRRRGKRVFEGSFFTVN